MIEIRFDNELERLKARGAFLMVQAYALGMALADAKDTAAIMAGMAADFDRIFPSAWDAGQPPFSRASGPDGYQDPRDAA